jgi:hypothetical protein
MEKQDRSRLHFLGPPSSAFAKNSIFFSSFHLLPSPISSTDLEGGRGAAAIRSNGAGAKANVAGGLDADARAGRNVLVALVIVRLPGLAVERLLPQQRRLQSPAEQSPARGHSDRHEGVDGQIHDLLAAGCQGRKLDGGVLQRQPRPVVNVQAGVQHGEHLARGQDCGQPHPAARRPHLVGHVIKENEEEEKKKKKEKGREGKNTISGKQKEAGQNSQTHHTVVGPKTQGRQPRARSACPHTPGKPPHLAIQVQRIPGTPNRPKKKEKKKKKKAQKHRRDPQINLET